MVLSLAIPRALRSTIGCRRLDVTLHPYFTPLSRSTQTEVEPESLLVPSQAQSG
jgi:hypothetical protein